MTSLDKMMKRLQLEHMNTVRQLSGEPLLEIPVELMTDDELKSYNTKTKKVEQPKVVVKKEVKAPVVKTAEVKKEETKVVNEVKKEQPKEKVELKKEVEVKAPEVKVTETKKVDTDKSEVIAKDKKDETKNNKEKEFSIENAINFINKRLSSEDEVVEKTEAEKKETVGSTIDKKIESVKAKINDIVKDVKDTKPTTLLIEDYNKLSSSKKKAAISNMLKNLVNKVSQENNCDTNEVLNFAMNISTIANQHNKREYNLMINSLKGTISKMITTPLTKGIINKLDEELQNLILINKIKFVAFIKDMNANLEINEENLDQVSSDLDSITSRLNNGEDFNKILKSFKIDDTLNSEDNHIEAKVVDTDENSVEDNGSDTSMNVDKTIFLSPEEVDTLASTMNEVLMGI